MADLDDEFLALVGGDESSDEEFNQAEENHDDGSRAVSESPLPGDDNKSKKATPAKKSQGRGQDNSDDEEEGEAYVTLPFIYLFISSFIHFSFHPFVQSPSCFT